MEKTPPERDDDIPPETRRELMHCAVQNGRISYWYLCDLFRRGRNAKCAECGQTEPAHKRDDIGTCEQFKL